MLLLGYRTTITNTLYVAKIERTYLKRVSLYDIQTSILINKFYTSSTRNPTCLFPYGQATAKGRTQTNYLGDEGAQCEVFLEYDASQDSFHLRDT